MYRETERELSYVYIYIYTHTYIYIYVYHRLCSELSLCCGGGFGGGTRAVESDREGIAGWGQRAP